jgi:hypothetical protein
MGLKWLKKLEGEGIVYRGDVVLHKSAHYRIDLFRNFIQHPVDGSEIAHLFDLRGEIENKGSLPINDHVNHLKLVTAKFQFQFWIKADGSVVGVGFMDSHGARIDPEAYLSTLS